MEKTTVYLQAQKKMGIGVAMKAGSQPKNAEWPAKYLKSSTECTLRYTKL
jgi:hypothetical protein